MVLSVTGTFVDLSVAIMQMTVSLQLYFAGDSFGSKYVGDHFYCNYADGNLYCNYAGVVFCSELCTRQFLL